MVRFMFGLQGDLHRREEEEGLAREAYLDVRSERLEAEAMLLALRDRRWRLTAGAASDGPRGCALQGELLHLSDEENAQWATLVGLEEAELRALEAWRTKQLQVDLLARLREAERDRAEALPRAA